MHKRTLAPPASAWERAVLPAALTQATETPEATPAHVNLDRPIRDYLEQEGPSWHREVFDRLQTLLRDVETLLKHPPYNGGHLTVRVRYDMARLQTEIQALLALVPAPSDGGKEPDNPFFTL